MWCLVFVLYLLVEAYRVCLSPEGVWRAVCFLAQSVNRLGCVVGDESDVAELKG